MHEQHGPQRPAGQSTFVTVLAWIFIVLSGFSTFTSTLQYSMISDVMPVAEMQAAIEVATARGDMPAGAELMVGHMRMLFGAVLLLSAITLFAAIGLPQRRSWARLVFIALMALGIFWNIAGLFLQRLMLSGMPTMQNGTPPEFRQPFETMMTVMQVASAVFALAFCVLFGWIIKRLTSAAVRQEFEPTARGRATTGGSEP